jgi:hypothetical protein
MRRESLAALAAGPNSVIDQPIWVWISALPPGSTGHTQVTAAEPGDPVPFENSVRLRGLGILVDQPVDDASTSYPQGGQIGDLR